MSLDTVVATFKEKADGVSPIGGTLKFLLDEQPIFIDGTGEANEISQDDKEANCTVITSMDVLSQLQSGDLNPMSAVMSGKVKIKGDMGLAMKLQSLLR